MESKIKNVMRRFDSERNSSLLQYWEYVQVGYNWGLGVADQLFVSTEDHEGLENYRNMCLGYGHVSVGPETQVNQEWLAGLAAKKSDAAYQRTSCDPYQFLGQLVVPVFCYQGAEEILAGVIELVTIPPKENYDAEFKQIRNLLKYEKLATKPLAKMKTIKVEYGKHIIKFPLSLSSGIATLWNNVTMRFEGVNPEYFRVGFRGRNRSGNGIWISSDDDLWACMANSSETTIYMFIKPVA